MKTKTNDGKPVSELQKAERFIEKLRWPLNKESGEWYYMRHAYIKGYRQAKADARKRVLRPSANKGGK